MGVSRIGHPSFAAHPPAARESANAWDASVLPSAAKPRASRAVLALGASTSAMLMAVSKRVGPDRRVTW